MSDLGVRSLNKARKRVGLVLVLLLLFGFVFLFLNHLRAKEAEAQAQAQRDAEYSKVLSGYEYKLNPGITRTEVKSYFESQKLSYVPSGIDEHSYWLLIGEEPGSGFVCDRWNVYIVFSFNTSAHAIAPSNADRLSEIKIQKVGHCL